MGVEFDSDQIEEIKNECSGEESIFDRMVDGGHWKYYYSVRDELLTFHHKARSDNIEPTCIAVPVYMFKLLLKDSRVSYASSDPSKSNALRIYGMDIVVDSNVEDIEILEFDRI